MFSRTAPTPAFRRQSGFSLIELVAAFVIFALGFGVLMQILSGSIRNARMSSEYTQAALWAQSKLDTVGIGEKLEEGSSDGDFDGTYRWELDVHKYEPTDTAANQQQTAGVQTVMPVDLFRLDLTVMWGGRQSERSAHFVTLRAANPDLGGGAAGPANFGPRPNLGGNRPTKAPRGQPPMSRRTMGKQ